MMCYKAFSREFRVCVGGGWVGNLENNVNLSEESLTIITFWILTQSLRLFIDVFIVYLSTQKRPCKTSNIQFPAFFYLLL